MSQNTTPKLFTAALFAALASSASAQITSEPSQVDTASANTSQGWEATPIFTVGETVNGGYQPVGILDGVAGFGTPGNRSFVLVNHELNGDVGATYTLANGTQLKGARVSAFRIDRDVDVMGNATVSLIGATLAYDTIYDRAGQVVTDAGQINEIGDPIKGIDRLCSAQGVLADTYGFEDSIYFTGEETGKPFHPHGGTEYALDVRNRELWALPELGRAAWENVTALETGDEGTVALLIGDDSAAAPLYLYIGEKDALGDGSFLDRNGLAEGQLYAWKADNGDLDPQAFNGFGAFRSGTWVAIEVLDAAMAGQPGYDAAGYKDIDTLQAEADALGCFSFSRPEDLATNPLDGTQAVFASTGRGQLYPADNWGTTYVVDVDFANLTADLVILHDADALAVPDSGIRNPDNLEWAGDGKIYIQEDRSTSPSSLFGAATGIEASIWKLDPITRVFTRIAEVDRSVVVPAGTTDGGAGSIGNWETSGVVDVTKVFGAAPGERLLMVTVQAHGIQDGVIATDELVQGGQLVLLSKTGQ